MSDFLKYVSKAEELRKNPVEEDTIKQEKVIDENIFVDKAEKYSKKINSADRDRSVDMDEREASKIQYTSTEKITAGIVLRIQKFMQQAVDADDEMKVQSLRKLKALLNNEDTMRQLLQVQETNEPVEEPSEDIPPQ